MIQICGSQLHFFFTRDSNHLNGDLNQSIKVSLIGIRIRILLRGIRITLLMSNCSDLFWCPDSNQLYMDSNHGLHANLLELGFESLPSDSSVCTLWNSDSNLAVRDSNHLHQANLTGIGIRITRIVIQITGFIFS